MSVLSITILAVIFAYQSFATPLITTSTSTLRPRNLTSGLDSVLRTYRKFGVTVPSEIRIAPRGNSGSVTVTPDEYDSVYTLPANVGPPRPAAPETYELSLDTGSSSFFVYATPTGTVRDTVTIAGLTVTSQTVQFTAPATIGEDYDGILGLAFSSSGTVVSGSSKTFFENIAPSLTQSLFTVNLKKGAPGKLTFGIIDSSQYSGSITYVPVNSANGFWEFTSDGYAIGSSAFVTTSIDAVVDTGTTLLYLPTTIVTAYYAQVPGAKYDSSEGGYTFPCTTTLPSITLGIGTYRAVTPGSYLNYAPVSGSTCFGGIQRNTGIGFSIFGDVFIKSQFVVFKGPASPQLGFAAKPT